MGRGRGTKEGRWRIVITGGKGARQRAWRGGKGGGGSQGRGGSSGLPGEMRRAMGIIYGKGFGTSWIITKEMGEGHGVIWVVS